MDNERPTYGAFPAAICLCLCLWLWGCYLLPLAASHLLVRHRRAYPWYVVQIPDSRYHSWWAQWEFVALPPELVKLTEG